MDPLLEGNDAASEMLPLGTQVRRSGQQGLILATPLVHCSRPTPATLCAQVFSSTVRYGRPFWFIGIGLGVLFPLFFILGVSLHGGGQAACLIIAFTGL